MICSHTEIVHGSHLLLVLYDGISLRGHFLLSFQELAHIVSCGICGGIVDEDDVIVGVFLHKDGVHVLNVSILGCVVKGGDDDTER